MRKTLYFYCFLMVASLFLVIFTSSHALAAWPLNTPDQQFGPVWAGEKLLWNDNRLGSVDIFMRDASGVVSPFLTGSATQEVLAASSAVALVRDDQTGANELYILDMQTHALHHLVSMITSASIASVWQKQAAWSDGQTAWWWDGSSIRTHPFIGKSIAIGPFGVALENADSVTIWQKSSEVSVQCPACSNIAQFNDQLAMLHGSGSLSLWPSGQVVATADPGLLQSNGTALLFSQGSSRIIYRDGMVIPFDQVIKSGAVLGVAGLASSDGVDISLDVIGIPTATVQSCDLSPNHGQCSGASNGWRVIITAKGTHANVITSYIQVISGQWSGGVVPPSAPDDTYSISVQLESVLGHVSAVVPAGQIIIDHTVPKITDASIEANLDSARIHIQTDEKTSALIRVSSGEENDDHTLTRPTFSHTVTVRDLDPDQSYDVSATMQDVALNEVRATLHFTTPTLTNSMYALSTTFEPKRSGVWEGELVVPPGLIDAKQAVLLVTDSLGHQRPIRLEWTVGIPPPNLARARLVRVKGRVNAAGTILLLHRSAAVAVIDATSTDPDYASIDELDSRISVDTWVRISGTLSSARKTGWKISVGDLEYSIHAESGFPEGFSRGDAVILEGYAYDSGDSVRIALQHVSRSPSEVRAAASTESEDVATSAPVVVLARAAPVVTRLENPISAEEAFITLESADSYDKDNILWYSIALYGIAIVISRIFFFGRGHKSRRS